MNKVDNSTASAELDNGLVAKTSMLPAAALLVTMLLCYAVSIWVFRNKSIGGFAWFAPLAVAGTVAVCVYYQQCLSEGVLSDSESWLLARNMSIWTALAVLLAYSSAQKSLGQGLVSLLMATPIFLALLVGGIFVVKTTLLMQNHTERGRDDRLDAVAIAKIQADFRRDRGIRESPQPAQACETTSTAHRTAIPVMPIAALPVTAKPLAKPVAKPEDGAQQEEDEIHRKIMQVRARALKEQHRAKNSAAKGLGRIQI